MSSCHFEPPLRLTHDDFKDYLSHVAKLHVLTSTIIDYYNSAIKPIDKKFVYELQEDIKNMVLSGLKPDGTYSGNAYALFIKDFLGLYIEDPKLYIAKLELGTKPDVKVIVEETTFIKFIRLLNEISEFILNKARELGISSINTNVKMGDAKQQKIEDLIAELIETSYKLSVGVNRFSTCIWGLRKITPHYMEKAYKDLPKNLLNCLGFTKLIGLERFELWGFPDYFTKAILERNGHNYCIYINGVNVDVKKPETLGGATCILNEMIWRCIDKLHEILSRWYDSIINVGKEYIKRAWETLNSAGWSLPDYLEGLYHNFNRVLECSYVTLMVYDESCIISEVINLRVYGYREKRKLSHYILLPMLFDDLMPAIFLGLADTTLHLDCRHLHDVCEMCKNRALLIVIRTT